MKKLKNAGISFFGAVLLLIGILFIVIPGPAILFIPLGLVLLAREYKFAEDWLRKYQRWSSKSARQLDRKISTLKYRYFR